MLINIFVEINNQKMYQPSYTIQPPQPSVYAFQPQQQVVMPPPIHQMNPIQSYPVVIQQPMSDYTISFKT